MPILPETTPVPLPIFMPQTSKAPSTPSTKETSSKDKKNVSKLDFKLPKLLLEVRDVMHPGSSVFLQSVDVKTALEFAVRQVLELLYLSPDCHTTTAPGVRSVTFILREMDTLAYTIGTELDDDHKEIHFSTRYINNIPEARKKHEIMGVMVHEMVHCFQYNGQGTCNGGLIEGVADWVRLNSDLSPPHWRQKTDGNWDAGYDQTAYFLDYIEKRYGDGTIRKLNEKLRKQKYEEKRFWTELVGRPVEQLWDDYVEAVEKKTVRSKSVSSEDDTVMIENVGNSKKISGASTTDKPTPTTTSEDNTSETVSTLRIHQREYLV